MHFAAIHIWIGVFFLKVRKGKEQGGGIDKELVEEDDELNMELAEEDDDLDQELVQEDIDLDELS